MSPTAFGEAAVGDPAFVGRLLAGRANPTLATMDRIEAFMAARDSSSSSAAAVE